MVVQLFEQRGPNAAPVGGYCAVPPNPTYGAGAIIGGPAPWVGIRNNFFLIAFVGTR